MHEQSVLWQALIDEWRLSEYEVAYINRQQGYHCTVCSSNLRCMALANGIMSYFGYEGVFRDFIQTECARSLRVLEINQAAALTPFLQALPHHRLHCYPECDMLNLAFEDASWDLVVHSDTLEHVQHPVRGLSECRRVLKPGGACAFTIPLIVGRLTISREGMPPSYHGSSANPADCLVHSEFGADAWRHVLLAGFRECRISTIEHPTAHAFVAVR
ncbi:MAG TPA: class I SAM-dependent methyltransferase [Vicinamibacterales bacterium]